MALRHVYQLDLWGSFDASKDEPTIRYTSGAGMASIPVSGPESGNAVQFTSGDIVSFSLPADIVENSNQVWAVGWWVYIDPSSLSREYGTPAVHSMLDSSQTNAGNQLPTFGDCWHGWWGGSEDLGTQTATTYEWQTLRQPPETFGGWHWEEWHFSAGGAGVGYAKRYRNGRLLTSYDTGVTLTPGTDTAGFSVQLDVNYCTAYVSKMYFWDDSGSDLNVGSYQGPLVTEILQPTSDDGTHADWTRSTGSNDYETVDDALEADHGADYVASSTVGDKSLFGLSSLSGDVSEILGVELIAQMGDDASGGVRPLNFRQTVESNGTDGNGDDHGVGDRIWPYFYMFNQDPDTAALWTESGVNAMLAGVEVTA